MASSYYARNGYHYDTSSSASSRDPNDDFDSAYTATEGTLDSPIYSPPPILPSALPLSIERIGAGSISSVWSSQHPSLSKFVIKREDVPGQGSLENEFATNQHVVAALVQYGNQVSAPKFSIPISFHYFAAGENVSDLLIPRFPPLYGDCNSLVSEKIPGWSFFARYELVETFVPPGIQDTVRNDSRNQHCLVRPYLGRRKTDLEDPSTRGEVGPHLLPPPRFFTLRNMVLHVDQFEMLDLEVTRYTVAMAEALAFLLWSARIDAEGVEFVLAHPRPFGNFVSLQPEAEIIHSNRMGDHVLWVLDFDRCRRLSMDARGVIHAAECFLRNDPYFPRPRRENVRDQTLWSIFRDRFLFESERILADENDLVRELPWLFMKRISDEVLRRSQQPTLTEMRYPRMNGTAH
ncbi:hypothetical protein BT67DRAFT_489477 [Trichocladium antarcticum]|uniref:DUF3669 domain-containing protein n=1 Tax=Trichocladium antarcticum TaxID=1450529 RepID=A0AAN6Z9F4_9PEZI|nr:hypothetical protein BT67DRAFT_489477 [Trichocladium antarcticum]